MSTSTQTQRGWRRVELFALGACMCIAPPAAAAQSTAETTVAAAASATTSASAITTATSSPQSKKPPQPDAIQREDADRALAEKRPDDAIANYELLCDRGEVNAAASFNRGLAYALRIAFERPSSSDHGQAIAAFEEAALLATDSDLRQRSQAAAARVRTELQHTRAARGLEAVTEPAPTFVASLRESISLTTQTALTLGATLLATIVVIGAMRKTAAARRLWAVGALFAYGCAAGLFSLREAKRAHDAAFQWAVVIGQEVRATALGPTDAIAGGKPAEAQTISVLPEGSLVWIRRNASASDPEIEWGRVRATIPPGAVRILAERP
jgi:hypothetical protein